MVVICTQTLAATRLPQGIGDSPQDDPWPDYDCNCTGVRAGGLVAPSVRASMKQDGPSE
jgi:hypothetical protein